MKPSVCFLIAWQCINLAAFSAAIEGLPEPAAARATTPLSPTEETLPNGLRLIVIERPGLPLVSAALLLQSGAEADPKSGAGLANLTAALLTQGTASHTATEIAREVESLGATLKATAAWDGSIVELTTLSANLAPAFDLLADVAMHPKFAPEEIERLRRQMLDELRVSLEEPLTVARAAASRMLLGSGLYAHPPGGTLASLPRLNRQSITAFHAAHYAPGQAQLVVVGNVTATVARSLADAAFGPWKATPGAIVAANPAFQPTTTPRTVLIDMPNAGQAAVLIATHAVPRSAEDYFAGLVANTILGGGYTSWLNQEIRVKRGLSYGARSTFECLRGGGTCVAGCQTKNGSAVEVATLLREQLIRLGKEAADPAFFTARQSVLTGNFARDLETNRTYASQIVELAAHNLPLSLLSEYPARVQSVTPETARAFAARHYRPEALSIIIAGRAAEIAKPLRAAFPDLEVIPHRDLDLDSPALRRAPKH